MTATHQSAARTVRKASSARPRALDALLPAADPLRLLDERGQRVPAARDLPEPATETLVELLRRMTIGRRLDIQCTALTKQGRLAVYPSARGQEAC